MSVTGVDLGQLNLRDALDVAILIEEEAQERYLEFAHQMEIHHTHEAGGFFVFMAQNEARHGDELRARRKRLFGGEPSAVTRAMIFDVEAPGYDEARAFMTPRQAMQAALRAEEKAHGFFVAALPRVEDGDVKRLFEELRDEEVHHQDLVRQELAKLPPDPPVGPEDFVDEPVGH
jgi:rubrerythrin